MRRDWILVTGFLIVTRALLSIVALSAANVSPGVGVASGSLCPEPRSLPCVWASWDGDYYLKIAQNGYTLHGIELAFFPAYPLLIRLFALFDARWAPLAGFLISNAAFIAAMLVLWLQVRAEFGAARAWETIVAYTVFPTSLFFSAVYTESLFLLFGVLVYWFSVREKFFLAAILVALAALTRPTGVLFALIPLGEILLKPKRDWARAAVIALVSAVGLLAYGAYLWVTQGSPLAFLPAQAQAWGRSFALPWQTVWDGVLVFASGTGSGRTDLIATVAFIALTIASWLYVRKSLFVFSAVSLFFLLVAHGPATDPLYSMARFGLGLFPCFIALAILLERLPRAQWLVWALLAARLFVSTQSFARGHWVA